MTYILGASGTCQQLRGSLLFLLTLLAFQLSAQPGLEPQKIPLLPGEMWWGGYVWDGHLMPLPVGYIADQLGTVKSNQAQPLLLSSKGRVIWSEAPLTYHLSTEVLEVSAGGAEVLLTQSGSTLREAFRYASATYFPPSGKHPDWMLFEKPQYNTWIELVYNQNEADVLAYARAIRANDFPAGVLMIDDNWQEDYGKWNFHAGRFPAPVAMVDSLHAMGFQVMLWICPFVSADSDVYRELAARGLLIREADGVEPLIVRWWNGASAVLDFTHPGAVSWFKQELRRLEETYHVDGFKLDAGDSHFYTSPMTTYDPDATPNDHTEAFLQFGLDYPLNEYRAAWKMGGQPLAQRLHDKGHNWTDLQKLIPQIGLQGILGYPFNCPDMIGGGEYGSFLNLDKVDQELVVRSAQIHALMPMMQFSVAPWRVLDAAHLIAVKQAVATREKYLPEILQLMEAAAKTGEPIVRLMEYEFPNQGLAEVKDQFMLGSRLLVAPVLERGATLRQVMLPRGKWKRNGKIYTGGKKISVPVGLGDLVVFERF